MAYNNKFDRLALDMAEKLKFMENFDPERSNREKRKLTRKIYNSTKKPATLYNEKGTHIGTGKDLCDCLVEDCPGCFFPCPRCRSFRCGHECRVSRKWMYDGYEVEGLDVKKINRIKN
ncbi:ARL14 effector protein [Lycorma delicatula]|uniref:ARL14 effector protein n=1 Tax=Lycorma delicatula TaxID=130591 RepID=UPI003F51712A